MARPDSHADNHAMNAACRLYNLELEVYCVGTNGALAEPYYETPFSLLKGPQVLPDFICKPYKMLQTAQSRHGADLSTAARVAGLLCASRHGADLSLFCALGALLCPARVSTAAWVAWSLCALGALLRSARQSTGAWVAWSGAAAGARKRPLRPSHGRRDPLTFWSRTSLYFRIPNQGIYFARLVCAYVRTPASRHSC